MSYVCKSGGGLMIEATLMYINRHFKDLPFTKQIYSANIKYVNTIDEKRLVGYTCHLNHLQIIKWFTKNKIPIPIFIGKNNSKSKADKSNSRRFIAPSSVKGSNIPEYVVT